MPEKKLFLIPCCASKKHNGHSRFAAPDPLSRLVSEAAYSAILETRREVLSGIRQDERYLSGKYEKNRRLEPGPDFGGQSASGLYLPAVQRYKGTLYSSAPALSSRSDRDGQILILSALYGPLHPLSRIQDYNLQMSDKPAYGTWKKRLPGFLRNYALSNGIREVHLFFGSSTYYLKAAQAAVESLLKEELIKKAVQYHVTGGSTRLTPQTHGELLEDFLKRGSVDELPGNVEERAL